MYDVTYLFVAQDDHGQCWLHPQEAVQFGSSQWEASSVGRVDDVHQHVGPLQVVGPVAAKVLAAANCSTEAQARTRHTRMSWGRAPTYGSGV